MLVMRLEELRRIARFSLGNATEAADEIQLSQMSESKSFHYSRSKTAGLLLANQEGFEDLAKFKGIKAWGAMLSFDLRKSSELAERLNARDLYAVMHTYMVSMLSLIERAKGTIVGLRGDGAIACFGLVPIGPGKPPVTPQQCKCAIRSACDCGDAITKAMSLVVNPVLSEGKINCGNLLVGVGIDVSNTVLTRIGWRDANELTAYGTSINRSCERHFGNNVVVMTRRAIDVFPKSSNGKTKFNRLAHKPDCYILRFPESYTTLG
jgi:hypothetical protein